MPKLKNKPPIKEQKEQFLVSLSKSLGILTPALTEQRITYNTYAKWFKEDEKFRESCLDVERLQGDFVENKLLDLIHQGVPVAIIFYLKCRRHEKWNDRNVVRIEGSVDHNIRQVQILVQDNPTKELMENSVKLIDMSGNNNSV